MRIDYPLEKLKFLFVVPNEEVSKRPIVEILKDRKVTILTDQWSGSRKGIHWIGQAWKQFQDNVDTDYVFFVDNDLDVIPSNILIDLLAASEPWDVIGPATLNHRNGVPADSYPYERVGKRGKYLEMKGYCMCWLAKASVFRSVKITDPDCFYSTFRKLFMMGYTILLDPTIVAFHADYDASARKSYVAGAPFPYRDGSLDWNAVVREGYCKKEDVEFYLACINEQKKLKCKIPWTPSLNLSKPRGDQYWKDLFGKR
jgi:hypothetical protein